MIEYILFFWQPKYLRCLNLPILQAKQGGLQAAAEAIKAWDASRGCISWAEIRPRTVFLNVRPDFRARVLEEAELASLNNLMIRRSWKRLNQRESDRIDSRMVKIYLYQENQCTKYVYTDVE